MILADKLAIMMLIVSLLTLMVMYWNNIGACIEERSSFYRCILNGFSTETNV